MTKDVLVSISGVHMIDGETDDVEVITAGTYYFRNHKHYVVYEELIEGVEGAVKNTIKIGNGMVDIIKTGSAHSHMLFEKEKSNVSCYTTPFGQMMVGINTNEIQIEEKENQIVATVDYTLDVNYKEMSRCRIKIEVQSKALANFHLNE